MLLDPAGANGTWTFGNTLEDDIDNCQEKERQLCVDYYISYWDGFPPQYEGTLSWEARESDS